MSKMNFGMRGHDFEAGSITELAEKFKKQGVTSIQLLLKKSVPDFDQENFSQDDAKEISETFKENGVEIAVLGCYINPSNSDKEQLTEDMAYFVDNLRYAKEMNAKMVGLETGYVGDTCIPERNHTEEAYQYLLENMRYLTKHAEQYGAMIGVEGVSLFVIDTPRKMKRLIDDLDSPNICVILDVMNYLNNDNYKSQDSIIEESFELFGDKIAAIHLKDFQVNDGEMNYVYPPQGKMNIKLILEKALQVNPNMPIILENVPENKVTDVIKDIKKRGYKNEKRKMD